MRLDELLWAIPLAWSPETRDPPGARYAPVESVNLAAKGQCIASTLLIQKHCGGNMIRCVIGGKSTVPHYFNELPYGIWVDVTRSQFLSRSPVRQLKRNPDKKLWEFKDTWERVDLLERRVEYCLSSTYVGQVPPWTEQTA